MNFPERPSNPILHQEEPTASRHSSLHFTVYHRKNNFNKKSIYKIHTKPFMDLKKCSNYSAWPFLKRVGNQSRVKLMCQCLLVTVVVFNIFSNIIASLRKIRRRNEQALFVTDNKYVFFVSHVIIVQWTYQNWLSHIPYFFIKLLYNNYNVYENW